jgi:hypothetical protein
MILGRDQEEQDDADDDHPIQLQWFRFYLRLAAAWLLPVPW